VNRINLFIKELKMARKMIIGITAAVLPIAAALFAAEKVKEKTPAEKPKQQQQTRQQIMQRENLLDQLVKAYEDNDRAKMGQIIKKMQQRREKMREFARFNKWHRRAHRRWAMEGTSWGCCRMPCGEPPCQRPCFGPMPGWQAPAGEFRPMHRWHNRMDAWGPPAGRPRPMQGWQSGPRHSAQPTWDTPKRNLLPPEEDW
jgi:hypothetical protein